MWHRSFISRKCQVPRTCAIVSQEIFGVKLQMRDHHDSIAMCRNVASHCHRIPVRAWWTTRVPPFKHNEIYHFQRTRKHNSTYLLRIPWAPLTDSSTYLAYEPPEKLCKRQRIEWNDPFGVSIVFRGASFPSMVEAWFRNWRLKLCPCHVELPITKTSQNGRDCLSTHLTRQSRASPLGGICPVLENYDEF
jgi:hypothetical protein